MSEQQLLIGLFLKCYDRKGSNSKRLDSVGGMFMQRRETSRAISVPADPGKGDQKRSLRRTKSVKPPRRAAPTGKKIRVSMALIDPKPLTRRSIADWLAKALPEYAMVAASTCEELLESKGRRIGSPNIVVVYIRSAGLTNICVQSELELLRVRLPDAPTVVLSDKDDVEEVNRALTHGVRGFIPTSVECEVAVAALRLINAGGIFVPADVLRSVSAKRDDSAEGERRGRPDEPDLTPRERSVMELLREGKPNKLIAAQLEMQESTVKVHVRSILKKLHAANRTHAASVANRLLG
jgi:DNA-binding NarL/FixJ family response regulator